jgi:hypothetical protein
MAIIQKLRDGFASKVAVAAVALPTAFGAMAAPALADGNDITIRYGDNVAENVHDWADAIRRKGVAVNLEPGLENPDCAALIHGGEEKYRYSSETLERPTIATVALRLVEGKRISKRADSTCPVDADHDITIRYGDNVEDMDMWVKIIEKDGVKVEAINNLENPNCAAVVFNGEEVFRFSADSVDDSTMSATVVDVALGETDHGFIESDCEVETVSVDADHDITIRYGDNIEDMDMWVEIMQDDGVKVQALNNLENPNCAAVVFDGKEVYRFSADSVDDATMVDIAIAIAQGDSNHGFTESDCQHDITIRYGDKAGRNTKNKNPYRE